MNQSRKKFLIKYSADPATPNLRFTVVHELLFFNELKSNKIGIYKIIIITLVLLLMHCNFDLKTAADIFQKILSWHHLYKKIRD